jgi:AcrR family transcriptional regulator
MVKSTSTRESYPISELGLSLRKEKKEATVQHILKTAEHIFAKRGLISPSIREIAEASGMSKQALMHHFPSKELLWSGVIEQIYINSEKLFSLLFTVLNDPGDEDGMTRLLDALEQPQIQNMSRFLLRAYIDEHEAQALEDRSLILLNQEQLLELATKFEIENSPRLYLRFTNLNLLLVSTIAVSTTKNTDLLPSQDHHYWRRQQIIDVINLYKDLFTSK